jgi:enterobactin synthetase component D
MAPVHVARWLRLLPDIAFDLCLDHGRCVGIHLPDGELAAGQTLPPEEQAFAASLTVVRRRTWVGGRVALRHALERAGLDAPPVLVDARGAPAFPQGIVGSISHKETLAVALVACEATDRSARVGVDVELDAPGAFDIASKVLTDAEFDEVAELERPSRAREVLLRFSAKEAIYKALDPFVRRYVAFKEIAVRPLANGSADVRWHLPTRDGTFEADVRWLRWGRFVLTTARVARI